MANKATVDSAKRMQDQSKTDYEAFLRIAREQYAKARRELGRAYVRQVETEAATLVLAFQVDDIDPTIPEQGKAFVNGLQFLGALLADKTRDGSAIVALLSYAYVDLHDKWLEKGGPPEYEPPS